MKKALQQPLETPTSLMKKENFSYQKCNTETCIKSPVSEKIKERTKESIQEDEIIASIAKKNIKNFLNYKRWKNSTTLQKPHEQQSSKLLSKSQLTPSIMVRHAENPQKAPDNPEYPPQKSKNTQKIEPITEKAEKTTETTKVAQKVDSFKNSHNSLKHIYKKMVSQKEIMTKSLSDMNNLLNKNKFSRTFSGEHSLNHKNSNNFREKSANGRLPTEKSPIKSGKKLEKNEQKFKKSEKSLKEINKLAQIVSKVKNFKLNFSDKNIESITKLLESVKKLGTAEKNLLLKTNHNNHLKNLQAIYTQPPKKVPPAQKKYLINSADKSSNNSKPILSIKLLKTQRKSFDHSKPTEKPKKELSPLPKKPELSFTYYMSLLDYFIRNPNDKDYFNLLYREHFLQSLAAYNYCIGLKIPEENALASKKIFLGPNPKNLKTLVFDLDETLVHCNEASEIPSDIKIEVKLSESEIIAAGVNIRPFSLDLLKELKESFEIVIFTASHSSYANTVIDYLDPQKNIIKQRLFREHCMVTEQGIFIKDLRIFGDRKLENIILVDNALYSFAYQIENGVPIIPFYDNKQDKELLSLKIYLQGLSFARDFREINKKTFKFRQYDKFDNIEDLLECLFQGLDFDI